MFSLKNAMRPGSETADVAPQESDAQEDEAGMNQVFAGFTPAGLDFQELVDQAAESVDCEQENTDAA